MEDEGFIWWEYLAEMPQTLGVRIVNKLLQDLTGRRGLRHEFDDCDDEIKKEIVDTWLHLAKKETIAGIK